MEKDILMLNGKQLDDILAFLQKVIHDKNIEWVYQDSRESTTPDYIHGQILKTKIEWPDKWLSIEIFQPDEDACSKYTEDINMFYCDVIHDNYFSWNSRNHKNIKNETQNIIDNAFLNYQQMISTERPVQEPDTCQEAFLNTIEEYQKGAS